MTPLGPFAPDGNVVCGLAGPAGTLCSFRPGHDGPGHSWEAAGEEVHASYQRRLRLEVERLTARNQAELREEVVTLARQEAGKAVAAALEGALAPLPAEPGPPGDGEDPADRLAQRLYEKWQAAWSEPGGDRTWRGSWRHLPRAEHRRWRAVAFAARALLASQEAPAGSFGPVTRALRQELEEAREELEQARQDQPPAPGPGTRALLGELADRNARVAELEKELRRWTGGAGTSIALLESAKQEALEKAAGLERELAELRDKSARALATSDRDLAAARAVAERERLAHAALRLDFSRARVEARKAQAEAREARNDLTELQRYDAAVEGEQLRLLKEASEPDAGAGLAHALWAAWSPHQGRAAWEEVALAAGRATAPSARERLLEELGELVFCGGVGCPPGRLREVLLELEDGEKEEADR